MGKRRKKGEGSVRQRKDGRWEGRVVIGYDEKGLPKTKNVLAKTKRELSLIHICHHWHPPLWKVLPPPQSVPHLSVGGGRSGRSHSLL